MSMVRHLPAHGWQPTVLTVKDGTFFNRDEHGLARVPSEVVVHRARAVEPFGLYNRMRGRSPEEPLPVGHAGRGPGFLIGAARLLRANLFIPDARVGWVPFAAREATHLIRAEGIDVVLSSGPPQSAHLAAMHASDATGTPWVADFRDPWTRAFWNDDMGRTQAAIAVDSRLEASALRNATEIVAVNEDVRSALGPEADRAALVPNGFESDDFLAEAPEQRGTFDLVYVGNMVAHQDTEATFRALAMVGADDAEFREAMRLVFVGNVHAEAMEQIDRFGLRDSVELVGFVPHHEAIARLRQATVCLFFGTTGVMSAKIYEYLATGRPVLAMAPSESAVDRLLGELGLPGAVEPTDTEDIRQRLQSMFLAWRQGSLPVRQPLAGVESFTRSALTGRIAAVLDRAATR